MILNKQLIKMEHKQTEMKIGKKKIKIDTKIISLVKMLNKFGIKTKASCQGDNRGYISIHPDNLEAYSGLVNDKHQLNFSLRLKFN